MADGVAVDPRDDGAEQAALKSEQRLIRRTRWRLVLWSGVSTLVVLFVLGAALYAAVANTLVAASVDKLSSVASPWSRSRACRSRTASLRRRRLPPVAMSAR